LNPESSNWTTISQKFDLYFLELPEDLLKLIAQQNVMLNLSKYIKTYSGESTADKNPGQIRKLYLRVMIRPYRQHMTLPKLLTRTTEH